MGEICYTGKFLCCSYMMQLSTLVLSIIFPFILFTLFFICKLHSKSNIDDISCLLHSLNIHLVLQPGTNCIADFSFPISPSCKRITQSNHRAFMRTFANVYAEILWNKSYTYDRLSPGTRYKYFLCVLQTRGGEGLGV